MPEIDEFAEMAEAWDRVQPNGIRTSLNASYLSVWLNSENWCLYRIKFRGRRFETWYLCVLFELKLTIHAFVVSCLIICVHVGQVSPVQRSAITPRPT